MEKGELLSISSGEVKQPFDYTVGAYGSRFLTELRDNKRMFGIKCPKCKRVYVPPKRICGFCFVETEEWVEVSGKGVLEGFTVVRFSFIDPATGKARPVPYGYGYIKLDGTDTYFFHFLEETDIKKLKAGLRVEPVFEDERKGSLLDIKYFRIINE